MTMKLVVIIPALNEEESVGEVIRFIPREIDGIDEVEVLLVNDGSTDRTVEVAKAAGVDRIVSFRRPRGLADVFKRALLEAVHMGADIIVNIDADKQYEASEMPELIRPILEGRADIVLGSRFAGRIEEMSWPKRIGNRFGTWVTRRLSGVQTTDAQTGYRAFTREAALTMNILSRYTYTQETIIQAGYKRLAVVEVPITFMKRHSGSSRLVRGFFSYGSRTANTVGRVHLSKNAFRYLGNLGILAVMVGLALGGRVLYHFLGTGTVAPLLPSAIAAGFGILFGVQLMAIGLVAGMVADNRELMEDSLFLVKQFPDRTARETRATEAHASPEVARPAATLEKVE